ncbi:T-cell surface glycoprotein CD1e, membrane-associated isoform X3 [Desmodus rotundus]|uniref:T-cell surface glycoprotein CD1e, membrane-associated isoform X3 n=1 Tax=Desmodus rotundus TaxID=9430 RepID=UPI002380DFA7|nr:T-cell surface glycoprotein CD1e, membrane-associated isoform X3 [Desmodus rotundus]
MLLLLLLLFMKIISHGPSTMATQVLGPHHPAAEDPLSFRLLQTFSFANHSWEYTQVSGWLGELQTHGWDSVLGTIRFLWPWSQGNFSKEELKNLRELLQLYFHSLPREVQAFSSQFQFEYPFELQISFGCRMHSGKVSENFLNGAYQGSDFLSFQGNFWKPSPGAGSQAQEVCKVLNHYRVIKEIVQRLLIDTCPRYLAGLLEAGKSELERQVKPEAWVSKGSSPGPGRLLLVCHVSGFHPKPVWVMWMRGEQEQLGTQRDGYPIFLICVCLAVLVTVVILVLVDSWFKKQSSNQSVCSPHVPNPAFPTEANIQEPKISGSFLCLAQKSWIKNRFLKKLKISLSQL